MEDKYYLFEPITAYREWKIILDSSNNFRLSGINSPNYIWKNKVNIAKCDLRYSHKAPNFDCTCGFWGYKRQIDLISAIQSTLIADTIISNILYIGGIAEFTGMIIEHENGYRAEKAKIKKLLWNYDNDLYSFKVEFNKITTINVFSDLSEQQYLTGKEMLQQEWAYMKCNYGLNKTFTKDEIIKSLQDYYGVEIEYYKDYFERKLNDSDRKTNKEN